VGDAVQPQRMQTGIRGDDLEGAGGRGVAIAAASTPWDSTSYRLIRPWTDDYTNLITVLKKPEENP